MKSERRTVSKPALAKRTWQEMFDFFIATRKERDPVIGKAQLSANDARGLWSLSLLGGKTMGTLAAEWTCDASNATWIVDRLEKRGLAERRPVAGDRRVKMVFLTPLGQKTRDAVMAAFYEPPPEILTLSRNDLEALEEIFARLKSIAREREARETAGERASERPA